MSGTGPVRQLMVTPTFVFSVVIVTMAILAFGTTQTYLHFSAAGPQAGCHVRGCVPPNSGHTADGHAAGGAVADGTARGAPLPSAPGGAGDPSYVRTTARITYRTIQTLSAGFVGVISITSRGDSPTSFWWLSVRYPGVQITWMDGATWHSGADASLIIEPHADAPELRPGATLRVTFTADGPPSAPTGCHFDGARCHIGS